LIDKTERIVKKELARNFKDIFLSQILIRKAERYWKSLWYESIWRFADVQPRFPKIGKDKKLQKIRKIEKNCIVKNQE
jgi:hypothetical protein